MRLFGRNKRGMRKKNIRAERRGKICEIMLPELKSRVICHFSPFKYDDTIIMSILLASIPTYEIVR